ANESRAELCDTTLGMLAGGALNAAMLLVAAAAFQTPDAGSSLPQAHAALDALAPAAASLFGLGLLVAGVASALTSSLSEASTTAGLLGRSSLERRAPIFRLGVLLAALPAVLLIGRGGSSLDLLV